MNKNSALPQHLFLPVFLFLIALGILSPGKFQILSLAASCLALIIFDRGAFRELWSPAFWIFIIIIVFISPALLGEKNLSVFGIGYSGQYFTIGIRILMRGLSLYMAILLVTRNVSVERLAKTFERFGFRDLSVTLPIAMNVLPMLRRSVLQTLRIFRARGGFRRNRLKNSEKLFLTIILNTIRTAEEIYQVIEAKKLSHTTGRKM